MLCAKAYTGCNVQLAVQGSAGPLVASAGNRCCDTRRVTHDDERTDGRDTMCVVTQARVSAETTVLFIHFHSSFLFPLLGAAVSISSWVGLAANLTRGLQGCTGGLSDYTPIVVKVSERLFRTVFVPWSFRLRNKPSTIDVTDS